MRKLSIICLGLFLLSGSHAALAADAKTLAAACVSCHGVNGVSVNPQYPNLAGQKSAYLLKQMRDFKTEQRKDAIMNAMVKSLSEQDMEQLAEYYSKM